MRGRPRRFGRLRARARKSDRTQAAAPAIHVQEADFAPFVVGLKVTLIVQVAWPASDLPQLLVDAN